MAACKTKVADVARMLHDAVLCAPGYEKAGRTHTGFPKLKAIVKQGVCPRTWGCKQVQVNQGRRTEYKNRAPNEVYAKHRLNIPCQNPYLSAFNNQAPQGRTILKLVAFLFIVISALSGCSKPTDAVIPSDMAAWDKELAPELKKLPEADREKVAAYLMRAKMGEVFGGKGVPPGTTIAQALDGQNKFEAEQAAKRAEEEALKKKLEQERAAAMEQLNKTVTVTLLAKRELPKSYDAGRYSEYQQFRIGVQNNSEKAVMGVSGEIKFIDVFDKEVGAVNFRISENIEPGKAATWTGGRDYNQFIDAHRAVWNLEDGKYTTKFVPEMVVFKDGTKLTVPN